MTVKRPSRRRIAPIALAMAVLAFVSAGGSATGSILLPAPEGLPASVVAFVSHVPVSVGRVTKAELHRATTQKAAAWNLDSLPKLEGKRRERLEDAALEDLIGAVWLRGQADAMGIVVTPRRVARDLASLKKQNFKNEAEYRRFLRESRFTQRDVRERVELQLFGMAIQRRIERGAAGRTDHRRAVREFAEAYNKRWRARTVCAPEYAIDSCSNGSPAPR